MNLSGLMWTLRFRSRTRLGFAAIACINALKQHTFLGFGSPTGKSEAFSIKYHQSKIFSIHKLNLKTQKISGFYNNIELKYFYSTWPRISIYWLSFQQILVKSWSHPGSVQVSMSDLSAYYITKLKCKQIRKNPSIIQLCIN